MAVTKTNSMQDKLQKAMSNLFAPVNNVSWDLMTGKVGVKTDNGFTTLAKDGGEYIIDTNPLDIATVDIPAFSQNVNIETVSLGDIIVSSGRPHGFVIDTPSSDNSTLSSSLSVLSFNGHVTRFRPRNVNMLGINRGVSVVKNLFKLDQDGAQGSGVIDPMMMMMLMSKDSDMSKMLPFMMMSGGNMNNMNPMMLMMMMSEGNPFDNLFK